MSERCVAVQVATITFNVSSQEITIYEGTPLFVESIHVLFDGYTDDYVILTVGQEDHGPLYGEALLGVHKKVSLIKAKLVFGGTRSGVIRVKYYGLPGQIKSATYGTSAPLPFFILPFFAPSYIMFKNNTYKVKEGLRGKTVISASSAASALNQLNDLLSGGELILIKEAEYELDDFVDITKSCKIVCLPGTKFTIPVDVSIRLKAPNIMLVGGVFEKTVASPTTAVITFDVSVADARYMFRDLEVIGGYRGIVALNAGNIDYVEFRNVRVKGCAYEGIYPSPGSGYTINQVLLDNVKIESCGENGIDSRYIKQLMARNVWINDCKGWYIDGVEQGSMHNVRIINPKNAPSMWILNSSNLLLSAGYVEGYTEAASSNHTIMIKDSKNIKLDGVEINGNASYSGIAVNDSVWTKIIDCYIHDNGRYGVEETGSTSDFTIIRFCRFLNNSLGDTYLYGTNSKVVS